MTQNKNQPLGLGKCDKPDEICNNTRHGELFVPCERIRSVSQRFMVPGTPISLQRARHNRGRTYDPQSKEKLLVGLQLKDQRLGDNTAQGILHFDIDFYFPLPQAKSKKIQYQLQQYHHFKPDIDNLIKFYFDVCVDAGIIGDDSMISSVFSRKLYCDNPRTEFTITELSPKDMYEK